MINAARLLLAGSVIAAPWLLGGAEPSLAPWFVWPLVGAALLTALASVLGQAPRCSADAWWVIALLSTGAGLGLLQLAPLFGDGGLPARAAELRAELAVASTNGPTPLSLDPASTRRQVAWLLVGASVVWQAATLFGVAAWRQRLLAAVAINGAGIAVVSLAQLATWRGRVLWIGPEVLNGPPAVGPFVYHNQAGAYFATCGACLVGWVLATEHAFFKLRRLQTEQVVQLVVGVLLAGGLLASYSRGAMLAAVGAGIGAAVVARRRLSLRAAGFTLLAVGAAAAALLLWTSTEDRTAERLASLGSEETYREDGRIELWRVAAKAAWDVGGLGAGLGGYHHVNPLYEDTPLTRIYHHAHNQYLEAVVEGGIVALALLLAAIAFCAVRLLRRARSNEPAYAAVGVAAFAALVFQALHGVVDFCLYLPANLMVFAVVTGLGVSPESGRAAGQRKWAASLGGVLLTAAAGWAGFVLQQHATADAAIKRLPWQADDASLTVAEVEQGVAALEAAARGNPDDGALWQALGEALLLRYRTAAREALAEELEVDAGDPQVWSLTKPSRLLNTAAALDADGDAAQLTELRTQELVVANLPAARNAFAAANAACPLLPKTVTRLLELRWLDDSAPITAAAAVDRVMWLSPRKPNRLFEVGALAFLGSDPSAALPAWRRCLELEPLYGGQVTALASLVLPQLELVEQLLPADAEQLYAIYADALSPEMQLRLGPMLVERATRLLEDAAPDPDERTADQWRLLGRLRGAAGRPAEAASAYQQAVRLRPTELEWRFELAIQLMEAGRFAEAADEAVFCMRLAPNVGRYRVLLDRLRELGAAAD